MLLKIKTVNEITVKDGQICNARGFLILQLAHALFAIFVFLANHKCFKSDAAAAESQYRE